MECCDSDNSVIPFTERHMSDSDDNDVTIDTKQWHMSTKESLLDVIVQSSDHGFLHLNSNVLQVKSTVFQGMDFKEKKTQLEMDYPFNDLKCFFSLFCDFDLKVFDTSNCVQLYKLSHQYNVVDIERFSQNFIYEAAIKDKTSIDDVIQYFLVLFRYHGTTTNIETVAIQVIAKYQYLFKKGKYYGNLPSDYKMFKTDYNAFRGEINYIRRYDDDYTGYQKCRKKETRLRSCIQSHLLIKDFSVSELQYLASLLGMGSCTVDMCKTITDRNILSHIVSMHL